MKKMFFPKGVNVGKTGFLPGGVNEVEETPGSVERWLRRGCTIVEEKPIIKKKKKEPKKEVKAKADPKKEVKAEPKKEVKEEK